MASEFIKNKVIPSLPHQLPNLKYQYISSMIQRESILLTNRMGDVSIRPQGYSYLEWHLIGSLIPFVFPLYQRENDFEDIGKSIDKSKESYDKAINKLSSGRGNLISRSQKFLELGVKPTKEISNKYIKDEE